MATKKKTSSKSKQTIEFKILDEDTKAAVVKCLQDNGKIKVTLKQTGALGGPKTAGYTQID